MHYTILYGSYREGRTGIRAAHFIQRLVKTRGHEVTFIDAQEVDLPMLNKMYKEYDKGKAPKKLEKLAETYRKTDGFIIIAGEYNHSVQPGLKNLLDYFLEEYTYRPSAIVCYSVGGFGGVRCAVHLRAALAEMGMSSIPRMLPIPQITKNLGKEGEDASGSMDKNAEPFLGELDWYAQALKAERAKGTP